MKRFAVGNALLLAGTFAASAEGVPSPIRMAAAAGILLVLPGASWLGLFRARPLDAPRLVLACLGLSSLSAIAGCALTALAAPPVAVWPLLAWTAVVVNAGLAIAGPPAPLDRATPWGLLGGIAAAGFLTVALAGLHLVPPLEDHDMEVRGTAYGLLAEGKPYFQSNRKAYLPMSHPILFNVLVAESLALTGEIEDARPSYDSAKRAERACASGAPFDGDAAWNDDHRRFLARPALAGTRAPSALMSALVLALLADLVRRLTASRAAGAAAALLYASFPETVVRSAYAGYFAQTVLSMLVAASLFAPDESDADDAAAWLAAAGAWMALLDHKTVVLVIGVAAWTLLFRRRAPRRGLSIALGFGAGTAAWWAYGLTVDARTFIDDHLRMHVAHRFLLNDVRITSDPGRYAPSMLELWRDFNAHGGYLFVPAALLAFAAIARRARSDERIAVLAAWFLTGAVLFTLTDWRQTKHLMNGLAPMVAVAVAAFWPVEASRRTGRGLRWAGAAALAIALALNLVADARLIGDFSSLRIRGASDVDGW